MLRPPSCPPGAPTAFCAPGISECLFGSVDAAVQTFEDLQSDIGAWGKVHFEQSTPG
jgi:hypothetical protein